MEKIKFNISWQNSPIKKNQDPASSTWAQFALQVGDETITDHNDWLAYSSNENVFLPLYYLAEWLVLNWWFIRYEALVPDSPFQSDFQFRHNIKFARSGFSLPNLLIQPQGSITFLKWESSVLKNHKCKFFNHGYAFVDSQQFEDEITNLIDAVILRLESNGVENTLLQSEWEALQNTESDEREFCIAAAESGIDPYDCDDDIADLIIQASSALPKSILQEFYTASSPLSLNQDINAVKAALDIKQNSSEEFTFIRKLKKEIRHNFSYSTPWKEGYIAAKQLRENLGLNGKVIISTEELSNLFNLKMETLTKEIPLETSNSIRLISNISDDQTPVFLFPKKYGKSESSRKFGLARGFYEYFFGSEVALISTADIESQKRNRAFAAEFLLPSSALRKKIKSEYVSKELIADLSEEYKISEQVVQYQIENHKLARIEYDSYYN